MSRPDRLEHLVERGFICLDDGDLTGAEAALRRAQGIDRRNHEVIALEGMVLAAAGDAEAAIATFERLAVERPDDAMPLINVATLYLHSRADAPAALREVDKALALVDDEEALTEAVMIKAEALLDLGGEPRLAEARATLAELATSVIDDGLALPLAELWLDAGDPGRALELAARAARDALFAADAHHLIGTIHDSRGNPGGRTSAWREVRRLDLAAPAPQWSLAPDEFDRLAHAALDELPARARELLGNVPILVEAAPSDELIGDGVDPRLLGLFSGTALSEEQSVGGVPALTTIHLFQRNLEASALDDDDLAEQIRITVLHETAHFFGLDEEELEALGLD